MQKLAFQPYSLVTKSSKNKRYIFDQIRKKFVVLTPEEWVRQHVVHYLLKEKKAPKSWINVEKQFNSRSSHCPLQKTASLASGLTE